MDISKQTISLAGIEEICLSEGWSSKPYLDSVKIPTIGYGSTYYEDGTRVTMSDPAITKERGKAIMMHMLNKDFVPGVLKPLTVTLNQHQIDALCSLVYNIGVGAFKSSTLLKRINSKDTKENISAAWRMWNKAKGQVIQGLVNRRERELNLYFA